LFVVKHIAVTDSSGDLFADNPIRAVDVVALDQIVSFVREFKHGPLNAPATISPEIPIVPVAVRGGIAVTAIWCLW
jgi:hypothetical protein